MDLNLLKSFMAVAETGSFTQAARQLKQPKSRISRAIQRLEAELGLQLLQRTTRQTQLTEAGLTLFQQNQPLLLKLKQNLQQLGEAHGALSGILRLTAPEDFAQTVLVPLLSEFMHSYPEIHLELLLGNRYLDLMGQHLDLAIRIGELADSPLIQRRLGYVRLILVASPDYLATQGMPNTEADLPNFRLLRFVNDNPLAHQPLGEVFPAAAQLHSAVESNQFAVLYQLALQGQGIASLPDFYAKASLQAGQLHQVLPEWAGRARPIHLLYPPSLSLPLRTRRLIEFLLANCRSALDQSVP